MPTQPSPNPTRLAKHRLSGLRADKRAHAHQRIGDRESLAECEIVNAAIATIHNATTRDALRDDRPVAPVLEGVPVPAPVRAQEEVQASAAAKTRSSVVVHAEEAFGRERGRRRSVYRAGGRDHAVAGVAVAAEVVGGTADQEVGVDVTSALGVADGGFLEENVEGCVDAGDAERQRSSEAEGVHGESRVMGSLKELGWKSWIGL